MSSCDRSSIDSGVMNRLYAFAVMLLLAACSSVTPPEERAMQAAQESYDHLLAGRYEQFLAGRAFADSLPDNYREQLLVAYKQFMHQQEAAHGAIQRAEAVRARIDTTLQLVQVFFVLNYADSTQEEIVVPMIEQDGQWKMK